MKPKEGTLEQVKFRAFPFALKDQALYWLFYLPQDWITRLTQMLEAFLDKYMPTRKISSYRKQITVAKMKHDEIFNKFWDRFQKLISSYPQHGYTQIALLEYFYEGLNHFEQRLLDIVCDGSLFETTHTLAKEAITKMAKQSK
ncbi:hypothetical protein Scep_029635 [Stephania cephalantha]|uniref:Retrotransposon gag domain-containing protein n=1 Tax=Stephania cephalantha TaxID=152367 RepID=A0AAP0DY19_9MAGN